MRKPVRMAIGLTMVALIVVLFIHYGRSHFGIDRSYRCSDCNVILISIDTLRHDHLHYAGYDRDISPNIDALASDGVWFSQAISHAPSTLPAHASMLTSLIPPHHGAYFARKTRVAPSVPTISKYLSTHGFRCASFNGGAQIAPAYGLDQGFEVYETFGGSPFEETVKRANAWLSDHGKDRFFMFLHTYESHYPFIPNRDYLKRLEPTYSGTLPSRINKSLLMSINNGTRPITDEDAKRIVNAYDAEIYSVDISMGTLLDSLRSQNLYDGTMIIFTSDHGEEFGEHGMQGWHGHTMYDELLRVPLIIKFPGNSYSGTTIERQVRHIDLAPTILDEVDQEQPDIFEGSSLIPLILKIWGGRKLSSRERDARISVAQKDMGKHGYIKSLRSEEWKLFTREHKGLITRAELYHLKDDPLEQTNLEAERTFVVDSLINVMEEMIAQRKIATPVAAVLTDTTVQRLKALGYME